MNTLRAYETDVFLQPESLKKFHPQKILNEKTQKNIIFCGSGDSLASAFLAESFSNLRVRAADPLDLLKNKSILKQKIVYLVSISGNTISNIRVAKIAKKSIGITSRPESRLAKACLNSILLKFPNSDVFTSGSISFLDSALTCISLVTNVKLPNGERLFKKALRQSKIKFSKRVFILGNLHTFPIAMYAAAKFYEILGIDAHYERLEQFSHMGLFSAKPRDTVIIYEEKNSHNQKLSKTLKKNGLNVFQPEAGTSNKISQFLFFTFVSQLVPLWEAKRKHQKEVYFVMAKKLRSSSDKMIY